MKKIIFILFTLVSFGANAQIVDTVKKDLFTAPDTVKHLHSKAGALIVPAALVGYGGLTFVIHPLRRIDYYVRNEVSATDPTFRSKAENYFLFAPAILVYSLNLVGVEGKNRFIDRTALLGLSAAFMGATTFPLKRYSHRLRPSGSDYLSFPSGHTAGAFMLAEFMAQEYGDKSPVYTIIGYSFATATGVFRMYNRAHWFSDVVAGAGFGIISTKLAYLTYPYIRNCLTRSDKKGKSTMLIPTYQNGAPGLSFAMQL